MADSPCVLITSEYGWSANIERIMKAQPLRDNSITSYMSSKKNMEVHPKHSIMTELQEEAALDKSNQAVCFSTRCRSLWALTLTSPRNSQAGFTV